jgi:3-deoxy-manno-octulosonate cytidylyltransferase (CMP-KDO synthetase)
MVIGIIPARWASSRFPGKPLTDILGKPMIQWVWEAASKSRVLKRVIVATDDERIYNSCMAFGAEAMMTSPSHPSGSDRAAEVAEKNEADIYVNIQGDEPLLSPENIDAAVEPFLSDKSLEMGTLKRKISDPKELFDINVVKVVTDKNGFALYFSRLPIPFERADGIKSPDYSVAVKENSSLLEERYAQIGLYVFRREFLFKFTSLPPSSLEKAERLEQLRALENGYRIKVIQVEKVSPGVDSQEDLEKIIKVIKQGGYGH